MKLYDAIMNLANAMGGSFDDAFTLLLCTFIVFPVLCGWAFGWLVDCGADLYLVTKTAFRFIRRNVVKFLRWFRRL